ncbi:hypothetical protein [Thermococcus sp.]
MRRKGFLLNATALVLLIPLLLLLATYENVSTQIIHAQSERAQIERTSTVIRFLDMEFQRAMELSGKRAVVGVVDYVSVTGKFIDPDYGANRTIADLIIYGNSTEMTGYDTQKIMAGQTLKVWLSNISNALRDQGYILSPSPQQLMKFVEIKVLPLDAFNIVVMARINHVKISDMSGTVVYEGPLPSSGDYVYSVVNVQDLEDPYHSAMTKGKYHRSIRACEYAYPKITPPIVVANGTGSGDGVVVGRFGKELSYNLTHIWDGYGDYITNLTINGVRVKTDAIIKEDGDTGVMVFTGSGSAGGGSALWCENGMEKRVNMTLPSSTPLNSLVLLDLDSSAPFSSASHSGNAASIRIYKKGTCTPAPYWIEYWGSDKILIWLNTTNTREYTVYYSSDPSLEDDGDISIFPIHNESVDLTAALKSAKWVSNVSWDSFFVRYSLKADSGTNDFDSGVQVDFNSCILVVKSITTSWFSSVPTEDVQIPIYLSPKNISDLGVRWEVNKAAIEIKDIYGNEVPFWIEYWNSSGATIWVKANLTDDTTLLEKFFKMMYGFMPPFIQRWIDWLFGWLTDTYYNAFLICPSNGNPVRGDGDEVFEFFDDFNESLAKWIVDPYKQGVKAFLDTSGNGTVTIQGGNNVFVMRTKDNLNIDYNFAVDFRMKPNFQYSSDWDTGIGLWDGRVRYYYYKNGWYYYLLHELFTDDISKSGDPLAIHWAKWKTKDGSTYYLVSFWSKEDKVTPSANRDYLYHKYEVVIDLDYDEAYFSDLTRNITNKYDGSYSLKSPVKYIYLVSDSESLSRGATFDWIFVRRYIDLSKLKQRSIFIPTEIQFIDDNPGNKDHDGDKLAILKNWKANLANYNGAWYMDTPQRYEVVVDKGDNTVSFVFTHNPNIPGSAEQSKASVTGNPTRYTLYAVIDNDQNNNAHFDWIVGAPYPYTTATPTYSTPENKPSGGGGSYSGFASVYDVQPLINCLLDNRYFAIEDGWSFFERLEGSNQNHEKYLQAAIRLQEKLGYLPPTGGHYPIGLVSFMIPSPDYDEKLFNLMGTLGLSLKNISSADYYFLQGYFGGGSKVEGYRVWGISEGSAPSLGNLENVPFFLDYNTAREILGLQGACQLLKGYSC